MKKILAVLTASLILILSLPVGAFAAAKPSAPRLTTAKNTSSGILLKWSAVKNADGYIVCKKAGLGDYTRAVKTAKTSVTIKSAVSGKNYSYKVYAYNKSGKSSASNVKSVTRIGAPVLKAKNTLSCIKLSWSKVKKATQYVLLGKKSNEKSYSVLYRGRATGYNYDNILSGQSYDFKVKALIGKARGAAGSAKTLMFLERPSIMAEEYTDMKGITLKWGKVKNAEGYIIYRSLKSENSFKRIKKLKTKSTTYIDSDITGINSYNYYIVAFNGSSRSSKSNVDGDVFGRFESEDVPLLLTLKKGETYTDISDKLARVAGNIFLKTYFHWESSDASVLKVDALGVMKGISRGAARVTVIIDPIEGYTKSPHTVLIDVTVK